jgi:tRNA(His) guanylyltransferase
MSDNFGDRMKTYERVCENILTPRLPVILRIDGNSFSKFTKVMKFEKPFDPRFDAAMNRAAQTVLEYCSGAKVAYVQSDEITILLRNDQTHETTPFLGNRTQKIASLCASMATIGFFQGLRGVNNKLVNMGAFDCRVWTVPTTEVNNVFLWRQQDCYKNFISTYAYWELARKYGKKTSQKMLHGLNSSLKKTMVYQELGVDMDMLPLKWQLGRAISKVNYQTTLFEMYTEEMLTDLAGKGVDLDKPIIRSRWDVDEYLPRFNEDKNYIERFMK